MTGKQHDQPLPNRQIPAQARPGVEIPEPVERADSRAAGYPQGHGAGAPAGEEGRADMISLIILLWACGAVAVLALSTLLPEHQRNDEITLSQTLTAMIVSPILFPIAVVIYLIAWG